MSRSMGLRSRHTRVRLPWRPGPSQPTLCLPCLLGGVFKLELFLPEDYPMAPPKIRFLTKIFHPNVDKLGRICLDVLKSGCWEPGWREGLRESTDGPRQLVPGAPDPHDPAVHPSASRRAEPRRPARGRRGEELEGGRASGDRDSEGMDTKVCCSQEIGGAWGRRARLRRGRVIRRHKQVPSAANWRGISHIAPVWLLGRTGFQQYGLEDPQQMAWVFIATTEEETGGWEYVAGTGSLTQQRAFRCWTHWDDIASASAESP